MKDLVWPFSNDLHFLLGFSETGYRPRDNASILYKVTVGQNPLPSGLKGEEAC